MIEIDKAVRFTSEFWRDEILPSLMEFVEIPCLSPDFDPDWQKHGLLDAAVAHAIAWCEAHALPGMVVSRHQLEGRTPLLMVEIPGERPGEVLLYGHLDKQPEFSGWSDGLAPWTPVVRDDRLYGRGGGDDGYAVYAAFGALHTLVGQGVPLPRIVILIECSEESGSPDLPYYMDHLRARIGTPGLMVALDSTCGNYEQLWCTTSLRGIAAGVLTARVLDQGVHSGGAGGIVNSSFRIVRRLLSRIEDEESGEILPAFLKSEVPEVRMQEAREAAALLAGDFAHMFGYQGDGRATSDDPFELLLNNTWRPCLGITGADGIPPIAKSGNVLRPYTSLKLSVRLPPTVDAVAASRALQELLVSDPPRGTTVTYEPEVASPGWLAPLPTPRLAQSLQQASLNFFGKPAVSFGCGGSIPFMSQLSESYPRAQFVVTGAMGPHSNAHGPNEFLHLPTATKLTGAVAQLIHEFEGS